MPRLEIRYAYGSTFEGGYTYPFTIERWLDGELPDLAPEGEQPVLMVPPFGPDGEEDSWGMGMSTEERRATLELEAEAVDLDDVEPFNPRPGTGLGSFMPPGVLTAEGRFHRMTKIDVAPLPS